MWFLFLTTVLPGGGKGGGEIVSQAIIDELRQTGAEVRTIGYRRPGEYSERPGEVCVDHRPVETTAAGLRPLAWLCRAVLEHAPYSVAKYRSRAFLDAVTRALRDEPAAVFVDHAQVHFVTTRMHSPVPPCVFIAHNVESEAYAQLSRTSRRRVVRWLHRRESALIMKVESGLLTRADQTWTLTQADARRLRGQQPSADVRTLDVPSSIVSPPTATPTCDIALIGSWSWEPNAIGLRWFSAEVVPRLPRQLQIKVAGTGASWLCGRHPNVEVSGYVASAERFLAQARVIAVPAKAGGGIQVKTLDAIACGRPVVATPAAVRGLDELPGSVVVVGEADAFAAQLIRITDAAFDHPNAEAGAWSRARHDRFRGSVAGWTRELVALSQPDIGLASGEHEQWASP